MTCTENHLWDFANIFYLIIFFRGQICSFFSHCNLNKLSTSFFFFFFLICLVNHCWATIVDMIFCVWTVLEAHRKSHNFHLIPFSICIRSHQNANSKSCSMKILVFCLQSILIWVYFDSVRIYKCIEISNLFSEKDNDDTFVCFKGDKIIILNDNIVVWD